ncbi:MAG: hypothetical protein ACKO4X_16375, partial [Alphaproteobacteria bacterium]
PGPAGFQSPKTFMLFTGILMIPGPFKMAGVGSGAHNKGLPAVSASNTPIWVMVPGALVKVNFTCEILY